MIKILTCLCREIYSITEVTIMFPAFIKTHGKSVQVPIVREYVNGNDSSASVRVMIISGQTYSVLFIPSTCFTAYLIVGRLCHGAHSWRLWDCTAINFSKINISRSMASGSHRCVILTGGSALPRRNHSRRKGNFLDSVNFKHEPRNCEFRGRGPRKRWNNKSQ